MSLVIENYNARLNNVLFYMVEEKGVQQLSVVMFCVCSRADNRRVLKSMSDLTQPVSFFTVDLC